MDYQYHQQSTETDESMQITRESEQEEEEAGGDEISHFPCALESFSGSCLYRGARGE